MSTSEEQIRELVIKGIKELGKNASPDALNAYVSQQLQQNGGDLPASTGKAGDRAILTAFGVNHPGVISAVSAKLSAQNCDILDLSQKIMQEFFTMIMLIDLSGSNTTIKDLQEEMNSIAETLKIKIYLQHEDVFRFMHRI
ncbi:MAG: ACT domain-containing protein [Ignavibacteriales bacterium]|nr:ACT domain-containing protein [Ignavibacteriales bacterium]